MVGLFTRDDDIVNNNTDDESEGESLLSENLEVTESSAIKRWTLIPETNEAWQKISLKLQTESDYAVIFLMMINLCNEEYLLSFLNILNFLNKVRSISI